jgi:trans-aconitate methyltransferase
MARQLPASPDDWDAHWQNYAESAVHNPAQRMRHEFIVQLLRESAGGQDARVLDLGSGQGDLFQKIQTALPNAVLTGIELSGEGVAISRRKVPRATFITADILGPPGALETYLGWATHAVCSEVLEHVQDPVMFLRAARNYLAPGAQLIVTVPAGPMSAFDRHIGHRQHFDRSKVDQMMTQAGFAVERTYRAGFPFFNLYRWLVIAGGKRLVRDDVAEPRAFLTTLPGRLMRLSGVLFRGSLRDSRFGWQLITVAYKTSP